jgi:hypothetical protein
MPEFIKLNELFSVLEMFYTIIWLCAMGWMDWVGGGRILTNDVFRKLKLKINCFFHSASSDNDILDFLG